MTVSSSRSWTNGSSIRIANLFFACLALFSVTFVLYFVIEMAGLDERRKSGKSYSSPLDAKEVSLIGNVEEKIRQVEEQIARNQETVLQLQSRVNSILRKQVPHLQQQQGAVDTGNEPIANDARTTGELMIRGTIQKKDFKKISGGVDVCPLNQLQSSYSDVQMQSVYDTIPFDNRDGGVWKQGWDVKYDESQFTSENPLRVFIVPHSHNDPGWIKTFEVYFEEQTKNIFNNLVKKLPAKKQRKFIWAEISYLDLWWRSASQEKKAILKRLLQNDQLEIVTGGWVMTDEANAHYASAIAQLIEGHEWIRNNLGKNYVPRHGWAIDPFGLSSTIPFLLKSMNFDGMLIQRAHYSIKKYLAEKKLLEFKWRQTWDAEGSRDIFTHLMPFYSYDVPHTCGPDPKVCCQFDFKRLPGAGRVTCPWKVNPKSINEENQKERAELLLDQYKKKATLYKTNVLFVPVGDDFRYDTSLEWEQQYSNYEKLIRFVNANPQYNAQLSFGTLGDYFDAVRSDAANRSIEFSKLTGDFFTYADRDDHYWSGYFTSRPFYKGLERSLMDLLRTAEITFSMALARIESQKNSPSFPTNKLLSKLIKARRSLALFQHHDGITGTAKTHVVEDYTNKMITALRYATDVHAQSLMLLMSPKDYVGYHAVQTAVSYDMWDKAPRWNEVLVTEDRRTVIVFNSLGFTRSQRVVLRINNQNIVVVEKESQQAVSAQINPVWIGKTSDVSDAEYELVFEAHLPALASKTYLIMKSPDMSAKTSKKSDLAFKASIAKVEVFTDKIRAYDPDAPFPIESKKFQSTISLENDVFGLEFNGNTGYLKSISLKDLNKKFDVALKFVRYGTTDKPDKSGAYLFMPDGPSKDVQNEQSSVPDWHPDKDGLRPIIRVIRGPVLSELHLVLPQVTHIVRVIHSTGLDGRSPEIENHVDITSTSNYELAMHFTTPIENEGNFLTDVNAFQMIRRKYLSKLPIQGNVYPMPSSAYIEDGKLRLSVLSKQPLGVSSLTTGTLEVMLDRRLEQDDNRGVGQGVLDNVPGTSSVFRLILESNEPNLHTDSAHPSLSLLSHLTLHSLLHPLSPLILAGEPPALVDFPGLAADLPCDTHLLTVRTSVAAENGTDNVAVSVSADNNKKVAVGDETIAADGLSGPSALLILHRVGADCRRETSGVNCALGAEKVNLKEVFKGIFSLPYAEVGPLSPLHKGELIGEDSVVTLKPMELHGYRIPLV